MVTIIDVAREAGVGLGTASRALNGGAGVAASTRGCVLAAAERLGYRPSRIARGFPRGRTHTLEVLIPSFTRYFYFEILRGIADALTDTDYSLVIRNIDRAPDRDRAFAECGARGRVDGALIVSLCPTDALLEQVARGSAPLALVDAAHPALPYVAVDHEASAVLATEHCLALGHRKVALVDRADDPFMSVEPGPRQRGYRKALDHARLRPPSGYEHVATFSPHGGAAAMEALLALPDPPTAVLAGSDMQAMGLLDAARQHGLRIPDDVSIVGYNDIELAKYLGLTTVRVPMREMGRRGVELLLRDIEEPEASVEHVRLPTELIVRASCGPPPGLHGRAQ
ncbi:MAG: LacI family transcriptional regulator [Chloroflexota bacterium]|nr:LacI family transcriptional regulator [Chloroflexota bacterium]